MKSRGLYSGLLWFLVGMGIVGACATGTDTFGDEGAVATTGPGQGQGGDGGAGPGPGPGNGGMGGDMVTSNQSSTVANTTGMMVGSSGSFSAGSGFSTSGGLTSSGSGGMMCTTSSQCPSSTPCCIPIIMICGAQLPICL